MTGAEIMVKDLGDLEVIRIFGYITKEGEA
jgi:thiamine pyrophosphate-dependent acetolactate synthase large subunit-like protein